MKIQCIEKYQFSQIEQSKQIIVHENARRFAIIDLGEKLGCYGFSWRSDLLEPTIVVSSDKKIWVGVDQRLVALNLHTGHIVVSLPLMTNILQIQAAKKVTVVLTESELLLFNLDGSIRFAKGLPELASEMSICDWDVKITDIEGNIWVVDIQTGAFKQSPVTGI
ncbi:hypothetical protein NIES4071_89600 [Calothrix sp. NIES-4071]|nr:hypothetical protein NIES4071_89600 [Calothrix sp. NIES-4071]BAZ63227.1 hypothetical protein NIES4105_89530 [Calothrix sp. NIES-4105]